MKLNHIIIGTDFSEYSDLAIRHGIAIARSTGAALRVAHVVETPRDWTALHAALASWHADSERRLARQVGAHTKEQVDISGDIVDAPSVAEGLESVAKAHAAGLVIVGTRGLTGLKQALLGSRARRVVRTVQAHVMVARGEAPAAAGYKRILIPTDFSPSAEKALQLALTLASPDAQFDLAHFWQVPEGISTDARSKGVTDDIAASVKERGQKLLESFQQDVANATFSQVQESPEHGIAQRLESGDYDLVAVGSQGRSKLKRWLLGSVAEATALVAPCAVAVARADS